MTTKPIFYSPRIEGAIPLAEFLATLSMPLITGLRNMAAVATDPEAAPAKSFKTAKAAGNALTVLIERQEKAGLTYGITIPQGSDTEQPWIAFSKNLETPPELNVELTRSPAVLAAQKEAAKNTTTKAVERKIENPRTPEKPADAPAAKARTDGALVVRALFEANPRRASSKAAQRLALLAPGMTVDAFVTAVAAVPGDKAGRLDKKLARRARRLIVKSVAAGHVELVDATTYALETARAAKK